MLYNVVLILLYSEVNQPHILHVSLLPWISFPFRQSTE